MILCANCKRYDHVCFSKVWFILHACCKLRVCKCSVPQPAWCIWVGHLSERLTGAFSNLTDNLHRGHRDKRQRWQPPPHFCQDWVSLVTESASCSETDRAARCGKGRQCGSPLNVLILAILFNGRQRTISEAAKKLHTSLRWDGQCRVSVCGFGLILIIVIHGLAFSLACL